jgi:predicted lipoprotein
MSGMNKTIKYIVGILALILLLYLSFDIQKLDAHKAANTKVQFNAKAFAQHFWEIQLPACMKDAPEIGVFTKQLELNPEIAFEKYAHKLGISKTHYLFVKGSGIIESVEEEFLLVRTNENTTIQVATDFIFGNAIRDGSGKVDINEFINMTDFNNVSVALNKLAKEKVVSRLQKSAKAGMTIEFTGAAEINEEQSDMTTIRVIPVNAKLSDG